MSNNNFWENMGRLMARKLAINGKQVNPWNPVDTVQILIDAAQRKPQKVNTGTKTAKPQNMGIERVQCGYKETGGAQSQAYRGRVPGSTYDKTQPGTYTPYTETGGAQGQAYQGKVPGSTYDKNKAGTYTPYIETGGAQGQAVSGFGAKGSDGGPVISIGYDLKGGTTLFNSTGIEDITKPRTADRQIYSPFQDPILRPDLANSSTDDFRKKYNEAMQKAQNEEARKKRAQIAFDEMHERRRQQNLLNDKQTIIVKDARDLSDPRNKETVKAVQKAIGMAEDGVCGRDMLARLEAFLSENKDQLDSSLVLSDKNLDSLFGSGTGNAQESIGLTDASISNGKGLPFQTNTDIIAAELDSLKLQARSFVGIDLSDPGNSDALKVVEKAIGLPEDGEWTPTVMNRLQAALTSEFDQFDTNTLRLSEKNLETLSVMYKYDHSDAEAATYFVLNDKNVVRMMELANKDTLSDSEIPEAFEAAKNIELFLEYNHDQLKKALLDYGNNKEAIDLYIKLFRLHYNLSLKSDNWQAFAMGAISEIPFVESGINWANDSDLKKVKEKADAGDELAQAFLNDHGIQMGNKFEVAKTAFHNEYLAGEITSIVGQIVISALLTGGALTGLNVSSKLAAAGIPRSLVPTFITGIKSAVTQTYLTAQEASKPGYDMNNFWDDLAKNFGNVQAGAVASLFKNVAGIIGEGPFAQLLGEIVAQNIGHAYDQSVNDGEEKSSDEKAKDFGKGEANFFKQFLP